MFVCNVLFLNQCCPKTAVQKGLGHGNENHQHANQAKLLRQQQTGQDDSDNKLHTPQTYGLDKCPFYSMNCFIFQIRGHKIGTKLVRSKLGAKT